VEFHLFYTLAVKGGKQLLSRMW